MTRPVKLAAYALTVLLLASYALVMWWVIHPNVPANYRAYYIAQSTTCMDQPVPGTYALGTTVSFLPDGGDEAKPLKACGWEGPTGDGTHAVGTSSRLRFSWAEPTTDPLVLSLDMIAITKAGTPVPQAVDVLVDGERLSTLHVLSAATPTHFNVRLPAPLVASAKGTIDVLFEFPDAVQMGPTDPETRWRSIKLQSAALLPGN